jgi:hypothetical protein
MELSVEELRMKDGCRKVALIIIATMALTAGNAAAICPLGDLDGNCRVGLGDLVLFSEQWLASTAGSADLTGDENVDMADLGILARNWRQANLPLVINEVMASNTKTVKDPQREYDDWIELFNAGDRALDVGGMYLTDKPSNPTKWMIPDGGPGVTTIAAGGFLQVWVDDDEQDSGLHASFSLDADGDDILLFDCDGRTLIDGFSFVDQRADISYGRYPDGDRNLRYMAFSTPAAANDGAYPGSVADTKFSPDRGFYDAPFSVTISTATEGAEIRYTTDGTAPRPTHGLTYTAPIPISTTTCVRAVAYKPGWLQTNVDTHTYIFASDVIHQPANIPGYPNPRTWLGGNKYAHHDYEMDPVVVNDPAYSSMIVDSLKAIPTMSLVTGRAAMDTYYWGSGESPASIELIYPADPDNSIQAECGVEPHSHNRLKRSLRLNFRAAYGDSKFKSDIFERAPLNGDSAGKSINKIVLRGGNNRCWARIWNPEKTTYTMGQWFRDTQIAMSGVGSHGTFVHLYINGIYWGLYNPVERPDAAFAALYLGGDDEDYYSVSHGGSHGGSATRYNYLKNTLIHKDMLDPKNYAEMKEYLNVESYIDYVLLSWFGGVGDWPRNNWWGANRNDPPEPFEYFLWDAEWSWETTRGHNNGWVAPQFRSNDSGGPTIAAMWHSLRANGDFMMLFADRAYKHLFNDGVLTDHNCIDRYLTLNDFIRDAIVAESARWGDSLVTVGKPRRTRDVDWVAAEAETIGPGFMADNVAKFVHSLRNQGYYPSVDPPVFHIRGGPVASDFQMTLSNPNSSGTVYYTLDGSDPRVPSPPGSSLVLVQESSTKNVLVPSGPVDGHWRGGGEFDDSSWIESSASPGGVGYETGSGYQDLISLDLESLMYNKHSTCYIRIPFALDVEPASYDSLVLKIRYDDAFVAWLNGHEIERDNFTGSPSWNSDGTGSHSDSQAINFVSLDVTEHIDSLRQVDNILAIQGMNNGSDSSDLLISVELELRKGGTAGGAVSAQAVEYAGPVTLGRSRHVKTRASKAGRWSALNEARFSVGPVAESLRITEIMYHPQDTGNPGDPDAEFIELKNIAAQAINLGLVSFDKGVHFTFADMELPPGGYVLVVKDTAVFQSKYGQGLNVAGEYAGRLDNGGERIRLLDAAGQVIHDFRYEDDWYASTDGSGYSLVVVDPVNSVGQDWADIDTWRVSSSRGGSPGIAD